jgi:tetratricopeptide (TPR) repeat protein
MQTESTFKKLSFWTFLTTVALLFIAFIPFVPVPADAVKNSVLGFGTLLASIFYVVSIIQEGKWAYAHSKISWAVLAVLVTTGVSAFVSIAPHTSLVGTWLEVGTAASVVFWVLSFFLAMVHLNQAKNIVRLLTIFSAMFAVVVVFQLLMLVFGPETFSLGVFYTKSTTLLGNWNDFGIMAGLVSLYAVFAIDILKLKHIARFLYIFLAVAVLVLMLVNSTIAWVLAGSLALFVFAWQLMRRTHESVQEKKKHNFPSAALTLALIAMVFLIARPLIGGFLGNLAGVSNVDVRPSLTSTALLSSKTIMVDPVFGAGPNRFFAPWLAMLPQNVNSTAFWNTAFNVGFGFIPSTLITLGSLGFLAWLALVVFYVIFVTKESMRIKSWATEHTLFILMGFSGLYLLAYALLYNPGTLLMALFFVYMGACLGLFYSFESKQSTTISLFKTRRSSVISLGAGIVSLIVLVAALYGVATGMVATISHVRALQKSTDTSRDAQTEQLLLRAATLNHSDTYYRSLAEFYTSRLSTTLADKTAPEAASARFTNVWKAALASGEEAVRIDRGNYLNWFMHASVYHAVVPLKIENAYENAKSSYEQARLLAPQNPRIVLALATLENDKGNTQAARTQAEAALQLKPNYTDAVFFLSALDVDAGNLTNAIKRIETAIDTDPNNAALFLRLGLLRYADNEFSAAERALLQTLKLDPNSLNARFVLGKTYERLGRKSDALSAYGAILLKQPGNTDIQKLISDLKNNNVSKTTVDDVIQDTAPIAEDTKQ